MLFYSPKKQNITMKLLKPKDAEHSDDFQKFGIHWVISDTGTDAAAPFTAQWIFVEPIRRDFYGWHFSKIDMS